MATSSQRLGGYGAAPLRKRSISRVSTSPKRSTQYPTTDERYSADRFGGPTLGGQPINNVRTKPSRRTGGGRTTAQSRKQRQRQAQATAQLHKIRDDALRELVQLVESEERRKLGIRKLIEIATNRNELLNFLEETFDSAEALEELLTAYDSELADKTRSLLRKALIMWKRFKVIRLDIWIISILWPVYVIQLKVAVFLLIAIGLGAAVDAASSYISLDTDGYLVSIIGQTFDYLWQALAPALERLLDIDLPASFNIEAFLGFALAIPFLLGILTMFVFAFVWTLTFTRSLTGRGSTEKIGWFIFCIFGYLTPILNLVPWVLFWVLAVWKNPR